MPRAPAMASRAMTTDELLAPPPIAPPGAARRIAAALRGARTTTASICRRATSRDRQCAVDGRAHRCNSSDAARNEARPQGRLPRRRARHPLPARHQGDAQGDADRRRPAAHPICGRGGARGRDRADDLRHRPRQGRARGPFRHRLRARGGDDARAASRSTRSPARAFRPARSSRSASRSRSASATPSGARARSSATSRSRCCCPTI